MMKQKTFQLTFIIFYLFFYSCEIWEDPYGCLSEDPYAYSVDKCLPDGGDRQETIGELNYISDKIFNGPNGSLTSTVNIEECGYYHRRIRWVLPKGASEDGYIVQKISLRYDAFFWEASPPQPRVEFSHDVDYFSQCFDKDDYELIRNMSDEDLTFWEVWKVEEDNILATAIMFDRDDNLIVDRNGNPKTVYWDHWYMPYNYVYFNEEADFFGETRFYTNSQMGDESPDFYLDPYNPFNRANSHKFVKTGLTTTIEPYFWRMDNRPVLERQINLKSECCTDQEIGTTNVIIDTHLN